MTPDPCEAHKRMTVPAVVCIENYSKNVASFAESTTAHPSEMSAKCLLYAQSYVNVYVYCKQMYKFAV